MWRVWKGLVRNWLPICGQTIGPASFKQQLLVYFLPQQIIFFSTRSKPKNPRCPVGTNQEHRYSLSWCLGGSSVLCHDAFLAHCLPSLGSLCSCRHWNKAVQWHRQTSSSKTLGLSCDCFSWHSFRPASEAHLATFALKNLLSIQDNLVLFLAWRIGSPPLLTKFSHWHHLVWLCYDWSGSTASGPPSWPFLHLHTMGHQN